MVSRIVVLCTAALAIPAAMVGQNGPSLSLSLHGGLYHPAREVTEGYAFPSAPTVGLSLSAGSLGCLRVRADGVYARTARLSRLALGADVQCADRQSHPVRAYTFIGAGVTSYPRVVEAIPVVIAGTDSNYQPPFMYLEGRHTSFVARFGGGVDVTLGVGSPRVFVELLGLGYDFKTALPEASALQLDLLLRAGATVALHTW